MGKRPNKKGTVKMNIKLCKEERRVLNNLWFEKGTEGRNQKVKEIMERLDQDGELEGFKQTNVSLKEETVDQIFKIAYKNNIPASFLLRRIIWELKNGMF